MSCHLVSLDEFVTLSQLRRDYPFTLALIIVRGYVRVCLLTQVSAICAPVLVATTNAAMAITCLAYARQMYSVSVNPARRACAQAAMQNTIAETLLQLMCAGVLGCVLSSVSAVDFFHECDPWAKTPAQPPLGA